MILYKLSTICPKRIYTQKKIKHDDQNLLKHYINKINLISFFVSNH